MSQFAHFFSENEIRSQPVTQIPWSTLSRVIIQKSSSKEEALWYINQAYKNRWSRAIVIKQFELQAYQIQNILPIVSDENSYIQGIIKDTLAFASGGVFFVNVILSPSHSTSTYSSTTRLEAVIL